MNDPGRKTRAGLSIFVVRSEIGNLEDLVPEWDDLYPDERTDFLSEWLNAMGHMRSLEELYGAGELSGRLHAEYLLLKAHVKDLLPTIRRLELAEPKVPLD